MNKKIISLFSILIVIIPSFVFGQKNPKGENTLPSEADREFSIQQKVYRSALRNNDLTTATVALYNIIALKPGEKGWVDSLAICYFSRGAYEQCARVTTDILASYPSDTAMLELLSVSQQALGLAKESLESYEKLYAMTQNIHHLYEISTLQFTLKRMAECEQSVNKIIADPESSKEVINLTLNQGETETVMLKAAAINLVGVMAMEVAKYELAEKYFKDALALQPEFSLAKGNLEYLAKLKKGPEK